MAKIDTDCIREILKICLTSQNEQILTELL